MRRWVALAAAVAGLMSSVVAEAKDKKLRIMLLDIPPDQAFSANVTEAMNDFLAGALSDQGFEVITSRDIAGVLGVERQRQLLGCNESDCLAEVGGAMGADYIVRGNVAVLDTNSAVTLSVVDAKAKPISNQRKLVTGRTGTELIKALEELVPQLVAPIKPGAGAAATPAGGLTSSAAPVSAPSHTPAIVSYTVAGVALVAAGVFCALSTTSRSAYITDIQSGTGQPSADQSSTTTFAAVAWGGLAVGLAGAALGTYFLTSAGSSAPSLSEGATSP